MNSNKHSRLIAAVCIVLLAVFSIVVFPFILAASPGNMDIEVIDMEDDFNVKEPDPVPVSEPGAEYEQPSAKEADSYPKPEPEPIPVDPDSVPEVAIDSNAISMEQAIEKARELYIFPDAQETSPAGEMRGQSTVFHEARYMESDDTAGDPSWFLLFTYRYWGKMFDYIPEDHTWEEYAERIIREDGGIREEFFSLQGYTIGTDNFGVPVLIWEYSAGHYEMVEINALTGEWIGSGWNNPVYGKALDDFDSWDDIKRGMDFWWTIERLPSGEIIREPLYHVEYDSGG